MINVITLCSGYDSQCMALEKIKKDFGLDYNLVAWAEIDKYACQAHDAVFPQFKGRNLGDMEKADWSQIHEDIDLLFYSTPCQDVSNAGLQQGFEKGSGTRSSIIWSTLDAIDQLRPKYLILENVKDMVSNKFIKDFKLWCDALEERDYKNFWKVLNAKDFGVPQNRERVFMVSVRDDEVYYFPKGFELIQRLKDILEDNVDEKYYLSEKMLEKVTFQHNESGIGIIYEGDTNKGGQKGAIISPDGICTSLTATDYKQLVHVEQKFVGYTRDAKGKVVGRHLQDVCNTIHASTGCGGNTDCFVAEPKIIQMPHGYMKGNVQAICPSITKSSWEHNNFLYYNYRIRKLTERECFRLMGCNDADIDKIKAAGISKTHQYKMAGNSIVVDVLYHIFRKLFIDKLPEEGEQLTLF